MSGTIEVMRAELRVRNYRVAREGAWFAALLAAALAAIATVALTFVPTMASYLYGWSIVWAALAALCAATARRRRPVAEAAQAVIERAANGTDR